MADSTPGGEILEAQSGPEDTGTRLDRFLAQALPQFSRSRLQGLIAAGAIACDGATIRDANHRVKLGDLYRIVVPAAIPATPEAQAIPLVIVYEDSDLLVVDKPAGLVVHPAAGNLDGTLVNALLAHCGDLTGVGGVMRPGIVHRIDKDTSGLLVVAKNERAMRSLAKQFAAHAVERAYNAVVWGALRTPQGSIEGNLGRNPFDRKRIAVLRNEGKPARTNYRVLERFGPKDRPLAALVECRLETGRTHQIRVHMAHAGHPLIGDATYGLSRSAPRAKTPEEEAAFAAIAAFPRQALHAGVLGFFHPTGQKTMRFESPWPEDLSNLINVLRGIGGAH